MIEHFFTCPACLQEISILVDPSIRQQQYIEDCEVCCRPLQIHLVIQNGEIIEMNAQLAQ